MKLLECVHSEAVAHDPLDGGEARGSSHPSTRPWSTNHASLRLDSSVYLEVQATEVPHLHAPQPHVLHATDAPREEGGRRSQCVLHDVYTSECYTLWALL